MNSVFLWTLLAICGVLIPCGLQAGTGRSGDSSSLHSRACNTYWTEHTLYWPGQTVAQNRQLYRAVWWSVNKSPEQHSGPWGPWKRLSFTCPGLDELVEGKKIFKHLKVFQTIASSNGGNRLAGTMGYDGSLRYIRKTLGDAYEIEQHEFEFRTWSETEDPVLARVQPDHVEYVWGEDFYTMSWSGSGQIPDAPLQAIDIQLPPGPEANSSTSGCEYADFLDADGNSLVTGKIALIQRGSCSFQQKVEHASGAGATGVLIFNEGQQGRQSLLRGTLTENIQASIPASGLTFALGQELANTLQEAPDLRVKMLVSGNSGSHTTSNLLAQTRSGNPDHTIMIGSHLDSVAEGPGINDNGSGSASLLEIAILLKRFFPSLENRVRFAWWSAEESGLIGSAKYVSSLSEEQWQQILMYINLDMVASPNFVNFIYDSENVPEGSHLIRDSLTGWFDRHGLPWALTPGDGGRSDHYNFAASGIPVSGMFTGAEGVKTEEEQALFGGTAGEAYDPCYHQACDTTENIHIPAMELMARSTAHSLIGFAQSNSAGKSITKPERKKPSEWSRPDRLGSLLIR